MKNLLMGLLWGLTAIAVMAAPDAPAPQSTLSHAKDVVLVKVDSVKAGDFYSTATFSIKEVLKGKTHGSLVLRTQFDGFKAGQEYVLCRRSEAQPAAKDTVAPNDVDGIPGWYCLLVTVAGDKPTVTGIGSLEKVKESCASKSP